MPDSVDDRTGDSDAGKTTPKKAAGKRMGPWDFKPRILILATEEFIVGLDDVLDIDWQSTDEFDASRGPKASSDSAIQNRIIVLQGYPLDLLGEAAQIAFRRMVGEGLARAFQDQHESAEAMLSEARSYYDSRVEQAEAKNAELVKKYESDVGLWGRLSLVLRLAQVFLGVVGIVAQLGATAANFGTFEASLRVILSLGAAAALGVLYAFGVGQKADRYREAARMLDVALDRFKGGDIPRSCLIDTFEHAERHIGSVEFTPPRLPAEAGSVAPGRPVTAKTSSPRRIGHN